MDTVEDRRAEDCPQRQKSRYVHRRACEGGRHEARVGNLEQATSDHRSVAQTRGGTPECDTAPATAREQRLGPGELLRSQVHVAAEALDQRTSAATYHGIKSARSERRS